MSLDFKYLSEALKLVRDENGRGFYTELEKLSGVTNIGRYARGEKNPSFDTWLLLHNAMPDQLPAPCYEKGKEPLSMKSTGDHNRLVQTSTYVENTPEVKNEYSPELLQLIALLDEYGTKAEIKQLLRNWDKRRRDIEKM